MLYGWVASPRRADASKKAKGRAQQTKAHRRKKNRRN